MKRLGAVLVLLLLVVLPVLAQVGQRRVELVRADYGSGNNWVDVTERVRSLIHDGSLTFREDDRTLGVDSRPGEAKVLQLQIQDQNGRTRQLTFQENAYVNLQINSGDDSYASRGPGELQIVRALYGAGHRMSDVTARLNSMIQDNQLSLRVTNDTMGGDPNPGQAKTLTVQYTYNGGSAQSTLNEGDYLSLPGTDSYHGERSYDEGTLQITRALYGAGNRMSDVTARLNSQIQDNQLSLQVTNNTMGGDPNPGQAKTLTVQYTYNGGSAQTTINEGDYLTLPGSDGYNGGRGSDAGTLQITRALYGAGNRMADVTARLNSMIQNDQLSLRVTNDTMGGDPSPNQSKTLAIQYFYNGSQGQVTVNEGGTLNLPGNYAPSTSQTIRCESNDNARNYCPVDTRGGVRLSRQVSGSACTQGSTWGYDTRGVWVDRGCRAEFEVMAAGYGSASSQTIRCESSNNARNYCPVDTRGGVRLARQVSGSACTQGSTWGYDTRGVWVDRGCRAEFEVMAAGYGSASSQTIRCESSNNARNYCPVDTRGGVRLARQVSGSACTQGSTWGYDTRGVWVDRGCRAEFEVASPFGADTSYTPYGTLATIPNGTQIAVRTNEAIDSATSAVGQHFSAEMYADVLDSSGAVVIPKGSDVQLVIRSTAGRDLVLDIDSLVVAGQRYVVSTSDLEQKGRQGVGANRRTVEMVGGGAAVGAIVGAIVGGGKGAAIGAGVGAAGGAGAEVLTQGKQVKVPAETVLNFRLDTDLNLQAAR